MSRFALAALSAATLALAAPRPPIDVYLIGDSTMADKVDPDMNPEVGWGMRFPRFFATDVHVHNHAVNGRSTKSFIDQGRWDSVTAQLKRGDYVFIEFGHNDEKQEDTSRYADPHGAYKRNLERFVADTRAHGAIPVLLTPIVRRKFDVHDALEQTHGDYPGVVRQVARDEHVPLIDLERETRALIAPLGPEKSKQMYDYVASGSSIMYPHGHTDDTHLSVVGATEVAGLAARAVGRSGLSLAQYVRAQPDTTPDPTAQSLWNGLPPGAVGDSVVDRPTITPFLVNSQAPVSAMIVFPGGGYEHLATDKEGFQVARWLNTLGISAFVVRYRLGARYHHPAMLEDAKQAMRVVRGRAAEWHVDPRRVGVIGFSAGGHLAATLETHFDAATRPDFAMLIYPVITMTEPLAHAGSRRNLLGEHPSDSLVIALSAERQVSRETPPTFIVASTDDQTVPVQNSLMMYDALRVAHVPVELHIFESARHGFGLANGTSVGEWTTLAANWLQHVPSVHRAQTSDSPAGDTVDVDATYRGPDGARVAGVPTFATISAAIDAAPATGDRPFVVRVRSGRYHEKLSVEKPNVHFVGDSRAGTVLTYDAAAGTAAPSGGTYGTRGSFTLRIAAPGFALDDMTVENGFDFMANAAKGDDDPTKLKGSQAVAILLDRGSDEASFRNCRISGHQDTLFPNAGRSYFKHCEILGSVDFIFGAGRAVFDSSRIISRDRLSAASNGYITAPSTLVSQPYGFLFVHSRLEKERPAMAPHSVSLGRPWHPSGDPKAIGSSVFIDCWMDDHISPLGWSPMSGFRAEDARFYEYGSTGPGAISSPTRRVLTAAEAEQYSIDKVLDGWKP